MTSESHLARIARERERARELHEDVCVRVYENVGVHVSKWNKHRILQQGISRQRERERETGIQTAVLNSEPPDGTLLF